MENIKLYEDFNDEEAIAKADDNLGTLILKFLWVRDQAHIFHWQTKLNSHHVILGDFYESYIDELDELAENLFGKSGGTFTLGSGEIKLVDYSDENLSSYLDETTRIFDEEFVKYFPKTAENEGIYHVLGDVMEEINKVKYLLSQE